MRHWRKFLAIAGLVSLLGVYGCASVGQQVGAGRTPEPFCIIALPDTQYYSRAFPEVFISQTKWIVENKDRLNIAFVVHEGDIVDSDVKEQWENANRAMTVLDGRVPYALAVGNHDMSPRPNATRLFNTYFSASRFEKYPWYGGHFGKTNDNSYCLFEAGGMKFMVISLVYAFDCSPDLVTWANELVAGHSDRRTIVLTHAYMSWDGRRSEEMWKKLVRKHKNIFMVLCGHITKDALPGTACRSDAGLGGNTVHQMLANYQPLPNGGNGWLRIIRFVPQENKIRVSTYSPYLNKYLRDSQNEFILEYDMTSSASQLPFLLNAWCARSHSSR